MTDEFRRLLGNAKQEFERQTRRDNKGFPRAGERASLFPMDGIEVIETEWGSELHQRLIAEKHAARVAYRDSPEAWEEYRQLLEAPRLEWQRVIPAKKVKTIPIYRW